MASYSDHTMSGNMTINASAHAAKAAVDELVGWMQNTVKVDADQLKAGMAAQAALNRLHALRFRAPLRVPSGRPGPARVIPVADLEALDG